MAVGFVFCVVSFVFLRGGGEREMPGRTKCDVCEPMCSQLWTEGFFTLASELKPTGFTLTVPVPVQVRVCPGYLCNMRW